VAGLGRLLTAMVTPFDPDGMVDYDQAKRLARALLQSGSEGVVIGGTTGEAPTLSKEEKLRLFAEIKATIGEDGAVIAGTGNYCTWESVELTKQAEEVNVDGLLLTVPYYNKPPQEGLYQHFKTIAASTHLPCIVYNIPGRTGLNMTVETTVRLSQIDNIVGVKDATGDMEQVASVLDGAPKGFRVWSGNDGDTFPILCLGGYGVICVISHLVGRQMKKLIQLTLDGRLDEAAELHRHLLPIGKGFTGIASNPIPLKYALNSTGVQVGNPRLPLVPPDQNAANQIDELLKGYEIDLAVPAY
jgi:4-hydroxy-tetrahydrodipicolinate synthase